MPEADLRVGVLGCAWIAHKNVRAIRAARGVKLAAVASRNTAKARQFLRECDLGEDSVPIMGYDDLIECSEVDALYVPLPSGLHLEWVKKAASAGKHILLEKPLSLTAEELREMWEACDSAKVAVLDGTMFTHHPRLQPLKNEIDRLGGAKEVRASFHFQGDQDFLESNIRTQKDLDGLGALGDLGWYTCKLALWVFGFERPTGAMASPGGFRNRSGVLLMGGGTAVWEGNRCARMDYSFLHPCNQDATIVCKKGNIRMTDFVLPREETAAEFTVEEEPDIVVPDNGPTAITGTARTVSCSLAPGLSQEALMFETFSRCCKDPSGEEAVRWKAEARMTQEVVLALTKSGECDAPAFVSL